jgi:hypothetical protein
MAVMSQSALPGRFGTAPASSAAQTPARTSDDLPEPEEPVTSKKCRPWSVESFCSSSPVSTMRPKKMGACRRSKASNPG